MPCNSSYNDRKKCLRETAQLLAFATAKLGRPCTRALLNDAEDLYCEVDHVPALCALLKALPTEKRDALLYDGRNPQSRRLADWWDKHVVADAKRTAEEDRVLRRRALAAAARDKLTDDEYAALCDPDGAA